jgi:hypothetical protein
VYKLQVKAKSGACNHVPPHVPRHRIQPPSQGGIRGCHVSSDYRTNLPTKVGSSAAMYPEAPDPLGGLRSVMCHVAPNPASQQGGLWTPAHPATPYGSWVSSKKKILAGLPVRQGSPVPNARSHVSKAPDISVIMGMQDVRAGTTASACKTCGYAATVQCQHY